MSESFIGASSVAVSVFLSYFVGATYNVLTWRTKFFGFAAIACSAVLAGIFNGDNFYVATIVIVAIDVLFALGGLFETRTDRKRADQNKDRC